MMLGAGGEKSQLRLVPFLRAPKIGHVKLAAILARRHRLARELQYFCRIGCVVYRPLFASLFDRFAVDYLGCSCALRVLDGFQCFESIEAIRRRTVREACRDRRRAGAAPSIPPSASRSGSIVRCVTSIECFVTIGSHLSITAATARMWSRCCGSRMTLKSAATASGCPTRITLRLSSAMAARISRSSRLMWCASLESVDALPLLYPASLYARVRLP